jgi:hypothetical protein
MSSIDRSISASAAMAQNTPIQFQKRDASPSGEVSGEDIESANAEIDTTTPTC